MTKIIRTPTRAEGGITDAERSAIAEHVKLWTSRAMRTNPVNVKEITEAIEDLYLVSGLKKPRVVVVPSPLVMAAAYGASAAIWYSRTTATRAATYDATYDATCAVTYDATRDATYAATRAATDAATYDATYDATRAATRAATCAATRAATDAATDDATRAATDDATDAATHAATRAATYDATHAVTYDATYDATYAATYAATRAVTDAAFDACYDLAGEFGIACAKYWSNAYQGGAYWAGYECYLSSLRDILGLRLPIYEKYEPWERAAIAAPFRVLHREFCIVSDFPELLKIDDRNLPHCADGPSHKWRDGWELYHWHGVRVPDEWIRDKSLTAEIALSQSNAELRRVACEILGWDAILSNLDATVIDDDGDPEIGTLVEVALNGTRERFLKVRCGTGRTFALPVPPDMITALQAQSWTWGLDQKDFIKPEVRT